MFLFNCLSLQSIHGDWECSSAAGCTEGGNEGPGHVSQELVGPAAGDEAVDGGQDEQAVQAEAQQHRQEVPAELLDLSGNVLHLQQLKLKQSAAQHLVGEAVLPGRPRGSRPRRGRGG